MSEPRARAGRNVGKMNFTHSELAQMLYGHGDVKQPLAETVRVLDEIATDFIQSLSLEANRRATHAGRQKVKFEDFQFTMRRNPVYMGRVQEVFEKKKEIETMRKNFSTDDTQLARDVDKEEKKVPRGTKRGRQKDDDEAEVDGEELLGDEDDDLDAELEGSVAPAAKRR